MRHFDEFAGNETGHKPVSSSVRSVVVDKKVVGVFSSLGEVLQSHVCGGR